MAGIKTEKKRATYDISEFNDNYGRITGGIEFGKFEVDGKKYTIRSITVGTDVSTHPVDFGAKRLTFEPGMTFEDLKGVGFYAESLAVSGDGLVYNKDLELVATYSGARTNVTVGVGVSWTRITEMFEDDKVGLEPGPDGTFDQERVRAALWQKPIRDITPSDWVVSFQNGMMVPGKVTRIFENDSRVILDFHGTYVTPGHVYYCAGGAFEGRYVPLIDILRDDGAVKRSDGSLMRASTGCDVGSEDDKAFWAYKLYTDVDGKERPRYRKQLRLGTRFLMPNGQVSTISAYLRSRDMELIRKGPYEGFVKHRKTGLAMTVEDILWV